jgi:hypothetical protein
MHWMKERLRTTIDKTEPLDLVVHCEVHLWFQNKSKIIKKKIN